MPAVPTPTARHRSVREHCVQRGESIRTPHEPSASLRMSVSKRALKALAWPLRGLIETEHGAEGVQRRFVGFALANFGGADWRELQVHLPASYIDLWRVGTSDRSIWSRLRGKP